MSKLSRRGLILTAALCIGLAVVVSKHAHAGETLRFASNFETFTLDPIKTAYGGDIMVVGQLFDRLLRVSEDGSEIMPGLAESWDISDDGLTYTFHLRDAQFSDGSPVTAEDVVFSLERWRDSPDSAFPGPITVMESAEAIDDKTVVVTLAAPAAGFLTFIEMYNGGIVSKAAVEAKGEEEFAKDPVGAGPFRLKEWEPGSHLVLEKNPNYWDQSFPDIDAIEWRYVPDDSTRVAMFQAGEVDVITDVPMAKVDELRGQGLRVPLEPSTSIYILIPNHGAAPFDDVAVRQAVAHAIDIQEVTKGVTLGNGIPANSTLPMALNFYDADLPPVERDVARAKELLQQAGQESLTIDLMASAGSALEEQIAVIVQSQLAEAGINVTIDKVDPGQLWDRLVAGDYEMTTAWWYNETLDPDGAARWALWGAGPNLSFYSRYNDDAVNALIEQASVEQDDAKRAGMYADIQEKAKAGVAQVPLFYLPFRNGYGERAAGLQMTPGYQFVFARD